MKSKRKEEKMKKIKGANFFIYEGHVVYPYNYYHIYNKDDYVEYEGMIFKSLINYNVYHFPTKSLEWEKVGKITNRGQQYREDDILIKNWKENKLYTQYDKVRYKGNIYMCEANRLEGSTPPSESMWWKECGSYNDDSDKKTTTTKVNNDRIGDIKADNVIIYGNHTGNISAPGEKSVVVIFGDVTGDITANQVIRLDNSDSEAVKAMFLNKQGKAIKQENCSATNILQGECFFNSDGTKIIGTMQKAKLLDTPQLPIKQEY